MSSKLQISATMVDCIEMAREAGGKLVRFQGGYWAPRNSLRRPHDGLPVSWHNSNTINALVTRCVAKYTDWLEGARNTFPIEMTLVEGEGE